MISFSADAAFAKPELRKDELEFLKNIGMKWFLNKVSWEVLDAALVTEVINTF